MHKGDLIREWGVKYYIFLNMWAELEFLLSLLLIRYCHYGRQAKFGACPSAEECEMHERIQGPVISLENPWWIVDIRKDIKNPVTALLKNQIPLNGNPEYISELGHKGKIRRWRRCAQLSVCFRDRKLKVYVCVLFNKWQLSHS